LIDGAARTLGVTDARRSELRELLGLAPGALASTRSTMTRLRTTLGHLDPLVDRLRVAAPTIAPAAQAATPTLRRLRVLLRDARPLLAAAGPTLAAARRASLHGAPLLDSLDPTVRRLDTDLLPFLERRDGGTRLRNFEAIGPTFSSVASAGAEFNDIGHIVQFPLVPGPNSALPLNQAPAAQARSVRACRQQTPVSARSRCPAAAGLLARIFGGTR
jgi:ABC-type transporter Mla subunit MlaD